MIFHLLTNMKGFAGCMHIQGKYQFLSDVHFFLPMCFFFLLDLNLGALAC